MDRENLSAPGWSHVLSTTNDVAELDRFRERVGAPPQALQLGNRRYPHLDLKLEPRERALADPQVRVFERTSDMLRYLKSMRAAESSGELQRVAEKVLAPLGMTDPALTPEPARPGPAAATSGRDGARSSS